MKRENPRVTTIFCSIVIAGVAFAANARAECSRETLQKLADTYVKAQTAGNANMVPLANGASYAENDQSMDIAKGVLAGALKVDFTRSFHDTKQCASFTKLVAATDLHPYVIHTAECIAEPTGHNPHGESTSQNRMDGNVRWALLHWRTRSFNRRW